MSEKEQHRLDALDDFHRARRHAIVEDLLARLRGEPDTLLSFEEVRRQLGEPRADPPVLREIPLALVAGSVGRYSDFTRHFLPRHASDQARWTGVRTAMAAGHLPPIEVYQLGGLYFVKDGNHRVSVARELGLSHLPALVSEVHARVTLSPCGCGAPRRPHSDGRLWRTPGGRNSPGQHP